MWIEHREPAIIQTILFTNATGDEQRLTFAYETRTETANLIGDALARTVARWEGVELVLESRMEAPEREFYFKDYWSLSDDGETSTTAHRDDDLAGQISVLKSTIQT